MNIDLLPVSAFALESFVPSQLATAESQTLTLQLALGTTRSPRTPMSGEATTGDLQAPGQGSERAVVLLTDATPLTITF